jgi:hypothetical protein
MRRVEESNKNVGTFARRNEGRPDVVGNSSFKNDDRGRVFDRVLVTNVGRCGGFDAQIKGCVGNNEYAHFSVMHQ